MERMTGTASMDQSKLRLEGQSSSQKLRAGRKRKVSALAATESSAEAGLSALAKCGGLKPIARALRASSDAADTARVARLRFFSLDILVVVHKRSFRKQTPNTVTP